MTIAEVEATLLDEIKVAFPGFGTVRRLSTRDIAEADEGATQTLVIQPPAILLYFTSSELEQRALTGTLYDEPLAFDIFVVTEDLSGDDAARQGAYEALDRLKHLLAGLKLSDPKGQVFLHTVSPVSIERGKAVYVLGIEVRTVFQRAAA